MSDKETIVVQSEGAYAFECELSEILKTAPQKHGISILESIAVLQSTAWFAFAILNGPLAMGGDDEPTA